LSKLQEILVELDAEIGRLKEARKVLAGSTGKRGGKRTMSPEARARISAAQKKRWALRKKSAKR